MKILLLLRHAKSSWDDPALPDHDRPLTERGKKDAKRIGQLLRELGLVPDLIVSSTAQRARKTASKVAKACGYIGEVEVTSRLYQAYPSQFIEVLREVGNEYATVLVVAHNPGLEELVPHLTGQVETMPTAALAQVSLDIERWPDLTVPPGGRLLQVWRPKDLA
ncbi:MAG TPA: histidine phosphatase family protein [Candidatus Anammoximicrobium sp.]|nr:histidine phosphatase family protein [Candidatus Anammoximicrobium sp.]HPM80326.1 histidine phosphatase family protein [Candidatus Anammoximicrobium sp.]